MIPPQLRWSCRRGMLELDVILGDFLEQAYLTLSSREQEIFARLLECEDQDLFLWLTGKESPDNSELLAMVDKVREHARTKHIS